MVCLPERLYFNAMDSIKVLMLQIVDKVLMLQIVDKYFTQIVTNYKISFYMNHKRSSSSLMTKLLHMHMQCTLNVKAQKFL